MILVIRLSQVRKRANGAKKKSQMKMIVKIEPGPILTSSGVEDCLG